MVLLFSGAGLVRVLYHARLARRPYIACRMCSDGTVMQHKVYRFKGDVCQAEDSSRETDRKAKLSYSITEERFAIISVLLTNAAAQGHPKAQRGS